jgi:hypothetical protein
MTTLWEDITGAAAAESPLWKAALRPSEQRELVPVFSPLSTPRFALAVETIYEGYLLHYGEPRLFEPADGDVAVLLGDYLYAHGLVRLADLRDVDAVADLAELISLCTQLRAEPRENGAEVVDGIAWAATTSVLGRGGRRLERARAALRLEGDPEQLDRLARASAPPAALRQALATHRLRVK